MLIQLPNTGDWVDPAAVLRVQKADDMTGVHVVTTDGAQMTVPVEGGEEAVCTMRDDIAEMINRRRRGRGGGSASFG